MLEHVDGGIWVGEGLDELQATAPFWAKVTSVSTIYYAWTEQRFNTSGAFVDLEGGRFGTTTINPAVEPNGIALTVPSYVLLRLGYYDSSKDWVYVVSVTS